MPWRAAEPARDMPGKPAPAANVLLQAIHGRLPSVRLSLPSCMATDTKRDLVSIDDLSCGEIVELFRHADEFREDLRAWSSLCRGSIMASLFFEPSTRTRLSFESAMLRLGGGFVTVADGQQ